MIAPAFLLLTALFLAYANGANDNFKGVATLFGSRTVGYRRALLWANATTLAGAACALLLYRALMTSFGGSGIVPQEVVGNAHFPLAVGIGAAATVLLATRFGFPISTTHALVGGIAGAGLVAARASFSFAALGDKFLVPLLVSPIVAAAATFLLYPALRAARLRLGLTKVSCLCIGEEFVPVTSGAPSAAACCEGPGPGACGAPATATITASVDDAAACYEKYDGRLFGVSAQRLLDSAHFLSAGAVCFARGLNDAPKIAAVGAAALLIPAPAVIVGVGAAMVLGGALHARRVAETMSERITTMNDGQGFTANLVTAILGIAVSRMGLPMSTTHVSCGALFGLGAATGEANGRVIGRIVASWVITLPLAAAIAALAAGALG